MTHQDAPTSLVVVRARAGDRAAQRARYEEYVERVFGFCLAFCRGDRETARDLTQESFARAFAALPELRDPAAFPKWLMPTARRCCLRWIERRQGERAAVERMALEPRVEARGAPHAERVVAEVIEACPDERLRETAALFYREPPHDTAEIAARLGITQTAVTTRLLRFRAWARTRMLGRLATALSEEEEP
jgi:RNA polymerase sigma-70 factor (ECF subfamily)